MPDFFSGTHILILLAVALLVLGPQDLPRIMRWVGQWIGRARRMTDEFKRSLDEMARQEELGKLRTELDKLRQIPVESEVIPQAKAHQMAQTMTDSGKAP